MVVNQVAGTNLDGNHAGNLLAKILQHRMIFDVIQRSLLESKRVL